MHKIKGLVCFCSHKHGPVAIIESTYLLMQSEAWLLEASFYNSRICTRRGNVAHVFNSGEITNWQELQKNVALEWNVGLCH